MNEPPMSLRAIQDYLRATSRGDAGGAADMELLARFVSTRDESAFELLVWRHAALVQRVCRAVLRDHHAAEDAAQAAFLVLARKGHTISGQGSVVGWLYRVARRIAVRLAKDRVRRATTSDGLERLADVSPTADAQPDEVRLLCAEVDRLPERYRIPVLLCFFEGLTHAEAARRTGWPIGSVAGRLARAKDLLARRLSRRGIGLAAVTLAIPGGSFVGSTARAATAFAGRTPVVPGIEPSVTRLAEGAMTMNTMTWKLTAASVALVLAASAGALGFGGQSEPPPAAQTLVLVEGTPITAQERAKPPAAADPARTTAQRLVSVNRLKQIMLAMHNYNEASGHFPANITDKDGKPLLSWRVLLLPYLEQDAFYKKFKLDEPWDSENNKKLLAMMPDVYLSGFEKRGADKTFFQGFAGPGTVFEPGATIKLQTIADGTSNTIGVAECGPPVEWTKPADIPYDPKRKLPKLQFPYKGALLVANCDGAVHTFKSDIDETSLRRLIERADGNPIDYKGLYAKFPPTPAEVKSVKEIFKQNEKLIAAIGEQLREQQKLFMEIGKKKNPNDPIKGIDLDRLARMHLDLERALEFLTRETEELKKDLEKK